MVQKMDSRLSLGKQLEHSLLAMSTAPQSLFFCREIRRFHGHKPFLCVTSPSMLVIHRYEIQQIFHSLKFPAEIFVRSSVERESVMNLSRLPSCGPVFTTNTQVSRYPQVNCPFKERPQHSLVKVIVSVH